MRIITGDECGLLKECIPEISRDMHQGEEKKQQHKSELERVTMEGTSRIAPKERQARSNAVLDMTFVGDDNDEGIASFASLRINGSLELWKKAPTKDNDLKAFGSYEREYLTSSVFGKAEEGAILRPLGLGTISSTRLCAADRNGNLSLLSADDGSIVKQYNAYQASKGKLSSSISYTPGSWENKQLATAFCCDPVHKRVAVGGRERETTLLDIETGKSVFKAKNLAPDPQTLLQQPVWPTAIAFMNAKDEANVMAVGTGYKQVRLYDVREDSKVRRPITTTPDGIFEYRVTTLCQTSEYDIVVGDTAGYLYNVDIRNMEKDLKGQLYNNMTRYVGPAGSIRQMKKHPTLPRLAVVGLDRMLRVFDTNTRKQLNCMYLKQRQNCLLFGADDTWETGNLPIGNPEDYDQNEDDVVADYVDSDGEENDEASESDSSDDCNVDDEDALMGEDAPQWNEESPTSDASIQEMEEEEDSSDDDSADEKESEPRGTAKHAASSDDSSDEDEEIIIKVPAKRSRKRY